MTERTAITGTVTDIDGSPNLVLTRMFAAPASEIWRELTESARLERWIGRWEGDPSTGHIAFFMTAEDDEAPPEEYTILECDPPRRFAGDTSAATGAWHLWFELVEKGPMTMLVFGQRLNPGEDVGSIGPGWEYYLDRLVAVHKGRDAATVAWDRYFPALQDEYLALVASG
ncbi:SRPBCC domain-containing protein [Microbacterium sp. CFBP9034]|uniref:SRPBCC domain-containing protein n=1 Tax=Microbacterium sp. CFBP9034 TaxID=3096540 RepID=UPI002A6B282F|nr:SRPBCC domain-containing protein [Microbacterium sp. CFBP9034]MDY0908343.1 SRPBCC domain-containing protein [Microbacterium sp. CFBP9034]